METDKNPVTDFANRLATDKSSAARLLPMALGSAVFMRIHELKSKPWSYIEERAKVCCQHIAEHGDMILYHVEGETAEAFNRLAEGIACLAFVPGGVTCFGQHWEATLESSNEPEVEGEK